MDDNQEAIDVDISEFKIASGDSILRTSGIGSCIVVVLYDPIKKIGGLSHSMLPGESGSDPKYVGSAIDLMLKEMEFRGADVKRLEARIVGGADVIQDLQSNSQKIGIKNIESAIKILKGKNIKVIASDIGENCSRSVKFNLNTGEVTVSVIK